MTRMTRMTLKTFLLIRFFQNLTDLVSDEVGADIMPIIEATQPTGSGQRNAKLFELARCLKFHPALAGATPKQLKPFVRKWHEMALPNIENERIGRQLSATSPASFA